MDNHDDNRRPLYKLLQSWLPHPPGGFRSKATSSKTISPMDLRFEKLEDRLALTVVINEFLAENDSGIEDAAGHRHDWIELKNTGAVVQDISNWYLTDNAGDLTKFQIPSAGALTTLDPGEVLLIYASGNNGEVGLVGSEIHTNFQLSQEPGYLALVQFNGFSIEHSFNTYPQQTPDVSYGTGIDVATASPTPESPETLVGNSSVLTVISPTGPDAARDDHWKEIGYDDSGWLTGTGSVGFDRNGDSPDLLPYIGRVLTTGEMDSENGSPDQYTAYVRYEFDVTDKAQLTSLEMNLRFDDGFIAYLNGKEIARANFAEDFVYPQPQWNSYAGHQQGTSSSSGNWNRIGDADQVVNFDLTAYLEILEDGANVLAFHGVNSRSGSSSGTNRLDFLIDAELVADRASGPTQVGFMDVPSPGSENGIAYDGFIEDTNFSVNRGIYDTTQSVAITTTEPGTTIRYTTDFSEPTLTNGTTYTTPLSISTTTVLRAKAFKTNFISTNVDTQTYIFLADVITQDASDVTQPYETWGIDKGDGDSTSGYNFDDESDWEVDPGIVSGNEATVINALQDIPSISVVTDWDNLWSGTPLPGTGQDSGRVAYEAQGIYIHGRSSERPNSLEYFTADGSESFQIDSVIEIQGHSSPGRWKTDKLSFQVKFKSPLGDPNLNFNLFSGTADEENAVDQFDTLILDAGYNYGWNHDNVNVQTNYARFVTDQVSADLQNLASGGAAAHGKYVHLYLDGLYWGIYNVHERPDEHFATDYYGGEKDDTLVVKHSTNDIDGLKYTWANGGLAAESAYNDLLVASRQNMSNDSNYQAVADILDIDDFIDYIAVHYYAGGINDWPHNNWYATYDSGSVDGKWRFHSWDQEHAFPTNDNGDMWHQTFDATGLIDDSESAGEIFYNLIENEEFRLRFSDRIQELMYNGGVLTPTVAQSVYEARTDEIDQAIIGESARWGDNLEHKSGTTYTRSDFINIKNGVLADFFPVRTAAVLSHYHGKDWLVDDLAPEFNQYGGDITAGFNLTITNPNGTGSIYYTLDGSDPRDPSTNSPSGTAILYTGSVTLNDTTQVRARVFADSSGTANDWSAEVNKVFTVPDSLPLRIVELMYNPAVAGELDYIEILNTGSSAVDLGGVQIADFSTGGYTFASQMLAAGERIVVAENVGQFQAEYPLVTNVAATPYSGSLSNGGELISLRDQFGNILQHFTYDDDGLAGWPTTPDGGGPSLEYIGPLTAGENPLDTSPADPFDDPSNWQASAVNGGTPGTGGATSTIDADFDNDSLVTGLDFLIWQTNVPIASGATNSQGDADDNQTVDATDLTHWEATYGNSVPLLAALNGALAAPAPFSSNTTETDLNAIAWTAGQPQLLASKETVDSLLVEETVDELVQEAVVSTPDDYAPLASSPRDEALATLGTQDSEDEFTSSDSLDFQEDESTGLAL